VLGPTLRNANDAFAQLNAAFPATRAFAREILPGVRETPATIAAAFPWINQTRKLVAPSELRGLVADLRPASRDLARLVNTSSSFFPAADRLSRCVADVLLPTGDVAIQDEFTTGQPNFREFAYTLVGLTGEGANSDGNGSFVHFQPGGGSTTVRLGGASDASGIQYANGFQGAATRPAKPSTSPRFTTSVPCYRSAKPDLNGPAAKRGSFGTVVSGSAGRRRAVRALRDDTKLERLRTELRPFGVRKGAE
jgi:phospholipid/cholesterol/gamma-HCH transport system substrate-binding protein